tara:strand:- start:143 stop:289 length:147 start_codon:yes stop_codon:yes gene_type:complete
MNPSRMRIILLGIDCMDTFEKWEKSYDENGGTAIIDSTMYRYSSRRGI